MVKRISVFAVLLLATVGSAVARNDESGLLWLVERADGTMVTARGQDTPFNPASVVKVGTSLLALEQLGPTHRYETKFAVSGTVVRAEATLHGDLVVLGGADPDFQLENAWLVADQLERLGIHDVSGDLVIDGTFWMGWDQGVHGRRGTTADDRALRSGERLRQAWNPAAWDRTDRRAWTDWAARRPSAAGPTPPHLRIHGGVRLGHLQGQVVVRHRSNPLVMLLKRFLVYSNNDIIRIAEPLGGPRAVERELSPEDRLDPGVLHIGTASGEEHNSMTPRQVVALLRRFASFLRLHQLDPSNLLPVPGCDPGPVPRMFRAFAKNQPLARTLVCKTGTLDATDGGVAVLAGLITTRKAGEILFCVAAPNAGADLRRWRRVEQRWLRRLIADQGGAVQHPCPGPFPFSDSAAEVEPASVPTAGREAGRRAPSAGAGQDPDGT